MVKVRKAVKVNITHQDWFIAIIGGVIGTLITLIIILIAVFLIGVS